MMKFSIISGNPNSEELQVLQLVADEHVRIEKSPQVRQSNWAAPQMRVKMPQQVKFGAGRNA